MIEKLLSSDSFEIWKMLNNPEKWEYNPMLNSKGKPYTLICKEIQTSLWISHGMLLLDGYVQPVFQYNDSGLPIKTLFWTKNVYISFIDRFILWCKVKKVLNYLDDYVNTYNPKKKS